MKNLIKMIQENPKVENFLAYVECLFRNKYTRCVLLLFFLAVFSCLTKFFILAIVYFILAGVLFFFLRFGMSSFKMYKRAMNHIVEYDEIVFSDVYCGQIGCKVAIRRFKKKNPEKYDEIIQKNKDKEYISIQGNIIDVLAFILKNFEESESKKIEKK